MKAAVVRSFDAPPRYEDFEEPVPQAGEKLVTIAAAGLHQIVRSLASGSHYGSEGKFPFVAGIDGVGRLEDGTRVYFGLSRSPFGTMAERGLASDVICIPLPDGLDDVTPAGIANPAMSSVVALEARAQFQPGESVLVLGATGVAGRLSVQVAKRMGARRVVGVGRNPQALAELAGLGADAVISLEQDDAAVLTELKREFAAGIDVVLDYVWGKPAEMAIQAIAQKGLRTATPRVRFIQIGSGAGQTIALSAAALRSSGLEILGSGFGSASMDQIIASVRQFFALAATQPFVFAARAVPLREVASAWSEKESGVRIVFVP